MKCIYLICLLLLPPVLKAAVPLTSVMIEGKGTRGPYQLGYRNLLDSSVRIYRGTSLLPSAEYSVHGSSGVIFFNDPVPIGDTLTVRFDFIPLSLQSQYYLHAPVRGPEEPSVAAGKTDRGAGYSGSALSVKGSKGFSIETGYGAGGLSQSLNLSITGDLVRGLKTSAHISDKSEAPGSTRRIEEIDRIYIEAESEKFKGTFGDFDYVEGPGSFAAFSRKLTGLDLNYHEKKYSLKGSAAFFPGEYSSMTITGVDGRHGPYYLKDAGGREGVAVLPGSEKVYIDGMLQKRGSEDDYIIDYEAGAVEFAPSKVIDNETRITVEYEIAREEYGRSFYSGGGHSDVSERLRFYGGVIQEGDRGNSPRSFELTDLNKQILKQAGADRLAASRDGAQFVGAGSGDYTRIDSAGVSFYDYVGAGAGDYSVTFSYIGSNEGSYIFSGGGIYIFAGAGSGDYEPVILLPLPQISRYGVLGTSYNNIDSTFALNGELYGSALDRNTLSDIDESYTGLAGDISAGYRFRLPGDNAYAGLRARLRRIGNEIVFPGRIDGVERYRDYDLAPESDPSGEIVREAGFESGLDEQRRLNLDFGYLERPEIVDRKRYAGVLNWKLPASIEWFGQLERTDGERVWSKRYTGLNLDNGRIKPSLRVEFERRDGDGGFKFYEYKSSIPAMYSSGINGITELDYRDEKYLAGGWRDKFHSGSIRQKVELISGRTGFSGVLDAAYFRKEYRDLSGPDVEQKSGSGTMTYNNPRGKGNFYLSERLTSSNERLRSKSYIFAGQGEGRYRYEDGLYIEDPDGDYVLVIEELGEGARMTEIATEINGSASPFRIFDGGGGIESRLGRTTLESELAYTIRKSTNALSAADFYPWRNDNGNDILLTDGRIDVRLYYYPAGTKQRWKYSLLRSYRDGNPYTNESVSERFNSDNVSWAFPAGSAIDVVLDASISEKRSAVNGTGYNVNSHNENIKIDYSITEIWTIEPTAGYEEAKQSGDALKARIPSAGLAVIGNLGDRGRISAGFAYFRVLVDPRGTYLPFQMASGKKEGNNVTANVKARLELYKDGRLDAIYRFEKFAARPERHNLKIEFTMLFQ